MSRRLNVHRLVQRIVSPFLVVSALAFSVLNAGTVHAAPRIALSAAEGRVGDMVALSGSGFVTSVPIKVYFTGNAVGVGSAMGGVTYLTLGETIANGVNLTPFNFSVPPVLNEGGTARNVGPGTYHVFLTYANQQEVLAAADFYVSGPLAPNPDNGKIGDYINVNGGGFKAGDIVNLFFSSQQAAPGAGIDSQVTVYQRLGIFLVAKDGTLGAGVSFQVPSRLGDGKVVEDVHGGTYFFYATLFNSRTAIATVSRFRVVAGEVSVDPAVAVVGSDLKVKGSGLRPKEQLSVTYDDKLVMVKAGDTTTDDSGKFNLTITVPESTAGPHTIVVTDVTGNCPSVDLAIKPVLTTVQSASTGDPIAISGSGFGEAEAITVFVNDAIIGTDPGILSTNRKGSFSGTIIVPQPPGATSVKVEDFEKNSASATVNVVAATETAVLTVTPATSKGSPGYVGEEIQVKGTRFAHSAAITVYYGEQVTVATAKTDAGGNFEASFKVPSSAPGAHTIIVSDGKNRLTSVLYMEDTPPSPPVPVIPEVSNAAGGTTKFDWSEVTDPSGVSYGFQIAGDQSFAQVLIDKSNLAKSEYTLQDGERTQLEGKQSSYYWRVQAVDGVGNASSWTVPVLFFVGGSQTALPSWIMFGLIGLGVLLVVMGGLWVRKYVANRRV